MCRLSVVYHLVILACGIIIVGSSSGWKTGHLTCFTLLLWKLLFQQLFLMRDRSFRGN